MYYPIFLNIKRKKCLVVGAGRVALRKIIALLKAKADVTVIAEKESERFKWIKKYISFQKKIFEKEDITKEYFLVIGATDRKEVNKQIYKRATELNIPCNVVDQPELCSFIVPSIIRRGKITIAISTDGTCPRFTRYLKSKITENIEPLYEDLLIYLGEIRERLKKEFKNSKQRSLFWEEAFSEDPIEKIKEKGWKKFREEIEDLIVKIGRHAYEK